MIKTARTTQKEQSNDIVKPCDGTNKHANKQNRDDKLANKVTFQEASNQRNNHRPPQKTNPPSPPQTP